MKETQKLLQYYPKKFTTFEAQSAETRPINWTGPEFTIPGQYMQLKLYPPDLMHPHRVHAHVYPDRAKPPLDPAAHHRGRVL